MGQQQMAPNPMAQQAQPFSPAAAQQAQAAQSAQMNALAGARAPAGGKSPVSVPNMPARQVSPPTLSSALRRQAM